MSAFLHNTSQFATGTESTLFQLSFNADGEFQKENFESIGFKKGQVIFSERNTPYGLYYVNTGRIKIAKLGSDGKEQIFRIAKPGDYLGYAELLSDVKYTTTATALEDSSLCFIPKEDFMEMLHESQALTDTFMKMVCRDLMEAETKMTDISYTPVRGRLAEALLQLHDTYEEDYADKVVIPISREDLAHLVGTAKETVIRLLSEFKDDQLIKTEGRKIMLTNLSGIRNLCSLYN